MESKDPYPEGDPGRTESGLHRIADADPTGEQGRPLLVSGIVIVLLAVLAIMLVIGVVIL